MRIRCRSFRHGWLPVALIGLSACASSDTRPVQNVNQLYNQLTLANQSYAQAVSLTRAGQMDVANRVLSGAMNRVKVAAVQCAATRGCDTRRFRLAYQQMQSFGNSHGGSPIASTPMTGSTPQHSSTGEEVSPLPRELPALQRSVVLLRGQPLSKLIAMNGPVKAALEMWLTQWRPNLMDAWVNYQYLRYQMWPQYQSTGLPEALLFGIMAKESGGKVHAVSRSGAAGPLQFMVVTGQRFGLDAGSGFDTRFDPREAARANAEYINEQLAQFNNNLELAIGAYNGGEGRMRRAVGADTSVSFYDPRVYSQMSQETREYVPAVLAAAWLFLHPDSYNLHFPRIDGAHSSIVLKRQASLAELTVCLGSVGGNDDGWFRTLRNLNPRLNAQAELYPGTRLEVPKLLVDAYAERCVDGPWPILAHDLHEAAAMLPPPDLSRAYNQAPTAAAPVRRSSQRYIYHRVQRGETLTHIVSSESCASLREVAELNHLRGSQIQVGSQLKLPSCSR